MDVAMVNYLAVIAAGVASMLVGYIWYSPLLFGKKWIKLIGLTDKKMKKMQEEAPKSMAMGFIIQLVQAYVIALVVYNLGLTNFVEGMVLGLWLWLGFVTATQLTGVLYSGKSFNLYAVDTGYQLVSIVVMSGLIAGWM